MCLCLLLGGGGGVLWGLLFFEFVDSSLGV